MKNSKYLIAFILSLAINIFAVVIEDDFSKGFANFTAPSSNAIKISDGTLHNETSYSAQTALKIENIGDFNLSFELLLFDKKVKEHGQFTIELNRGYGIWRLHFSKNNAFSQIASRFYLKGRKTPIFDEVISFDLPFESWLKINIEASAKNLKLQINDQKFILGTAPGGGKISFGSYRQPFAMRNFKIDYGEPNKLSTNLIMNSSFEFATNADVPDYWRGFGERYRTMGLPKMLCSAEGRNEYREKFYIDSKETYHGGKSIRIQSPCHLINQLMTLPADKSFVLSCYAKSNHDNAEIMLGITADTIKKPLKAEKFKLNRQWRRITLPLNNIKGKISVFAQPQGDAAFWLDAFQLEPGTQVTEYDQCWLDSGFELPYDVNRNQCAGNVKSIRSNTSPRQLIPYTGLQISKLEFIPADTQKNRFELKLNLKNTDEKAISGTIAAIISAKSENEQQKSAGFALEPKQENEVKFTDITIRDLRAALQLSFIDDSHKIIKQTRQLVDMPHPMRIYSEYSSYSHDNEARIVVDFHGEAMILPDGAKIEITTMVAGYPAYVCTRNTFPLNPKDSRQIFTIPIRKQTGEKLFILRGTLRNADNKVILIKDTELFVSAPSRPEIRINRINRGVYVDGKPFFPRGIQCVGFQEKQLEYYKSCGFEDLQYISHWMKPDESVAFAGLCEKMDLKAIAFHIPRPFSPAPAAMLKRLRSSKSIVGMIPNDEISDRIVYKETEAVKQTAPEKLIWINHNFFTYRAFANRLEDMPGDVISIDRYPFILQPPGRPQSTMDIYSIEQCLKMMDRDAQRERKPVYLWLQSGEGFAKEPTPEQLTWQVYIAIVNHAMGFSYFGGMPQSDIVWNKMIELNREIDILIPALFSLETEPAVICDNPEIRLLAKKLANEITVIAINGSLKKESAGIKLPGLTHSGKIEVEFENRRTETNSQGEWSDEFAPLERHVYKIRI